MRANVWNNQRANPDIRRRSGKLQLTILDLEETVSEESRDPKDWSADSSEDPYASYFAGHRERCCCWQRGVLGICDQQLLSRGSSRLSKMPSLRVARKRARAERAGSIWPRKTSQGNVQGREEFTQYRSQRTERRYWEVDGDRSSIRYIRPQIRRFS